MQINVNASKQYVKLEVSDDISFRIDGDGRWSTFRASGHFFRRTLDDKVIIQNKQLPECKAARVHEEVRFRLLLIYQQVKERYSSIKLMGSDSFLVNMLIKSQEWDKEKLHSNAVLFNQTYPEAVPILPPDRYHDIVVLPATGCPHGKCSFCAFYKDTRFQPMSLAEFYRHLDSVQLLFGAALGGREGIFLGSANALALPQKKMIAILDKINQKFDCRKRGIASFFDPGHAPVRGIDQWAELNGAGVSQVVIGLETGLPSLRKTLGKSERLAPLERSVKLIKQAGIKVGLSVLLNVGDKKTEAAHKNATIQFISQLALSREDVIYISPLQPNRSSSRELRVDEFKVDLQQVTSAKLVNYGMDKFYYYA